MTSTVVKTGAEVMSVGQLVIIDANEIEGTMHFHKRCFRHGQINEPNKQNMTNHMLDSNAGSEMLSIQNLTLMYECAKVNKTTWCTSATAIVLKVGDVVGSCYYGL